MDEKDFNGIWNNIALKEIQKIIDTYKSKRIIVKLREDAYSFKKNTHSRYECERDNFRKKAHIPDNDKLDRHKVASLFYFAFVDKDFNRKGKPEYSVIAYDDNKGRLLHFDATITHEIAFNIARGIIVSFIVSDSKIDSGYSTYVSKNGFIEPDLICFSEKDNTNYKDEVLKQLIYIQNEKKLSVAMLSILFSSIENNTLVNYKFSK